jgi:hypothetical protein
MIKKLKSEVAMPKKPSTSSSEPLSSVYVKAVAFTWSLEKNLYFILETRHLGPGLGSIRTFAILFVVATKN